MHTTTTHTKLLIFGFAVIVPVGEDIQVQKAEDQGADFMHRLHINNSDTFLEVYEKINGDFKIVLKHSSYIHETNWRQGETHYILVDNDGIISVNGEGFSRVFYMKNNFDSRMFSSNLRRKDPIENSCYSLDGSTLSMIDWRDLTMTFNIITGQETAWLTLEEIEAL